MHTFKIKEDICGGDSLTLIAGPCVIESREHSLKMAHSLKEISDKVNLPIIFKSSFDKANRSSLNSFACK